MLPDPLFLNVHMYGIMVGVGVMAAFLILSFYCKRAGVSQKFSDFMFYNGLLSVAVGFGSAALFQAIYDYIEDPSMGFRFDGGITFIGGLIGGVVFFLAVYFIMRKRIDGRLSEVLNVVPCCITVAHGFGRIGCFFAGCCYGKATDSFLGVKFPQLAYKVHPTQLYEAAFLFLLFAVMAYLVFCKGFRHNMSVYLICYGIFRFLIEFLRDDHRGQLVAGMSPSQFWSVLMVALGIVLIFLYGRFLPKTDYEEDVVGGADDEESRED